MAEKIKNTVRAVSAGLAAACVALVAIAQPATAQNQRTVLGQEYVPTVWVDPDGCEHWVMDDGVEGYMTPHVSRQGIPVCRRGNVCGVMNSDQFFATDKFYINAANRQSLAQFFQNSTASAFIIAGHTDSRASDDYNMRLSYNRANAVAKVGRQAGARIVDVRGYGDEPHVGRHGAEPPC